MLTGVWFWLSWGNNVISLGLGFESGTEVLVSYDLKFEGKQFEIGAVGFRTTEEVGTWEFSQMESEFVLSVHDYCTLMYLRQIDKNKGRHLSILYHAICVKSTLMHIVVILTPSLNIDIILPAFTLH